MSDHAQPAPQQAPTRAPPRPATSEPLQDELADLQDLRERVGNQATAALVASATAGGGQPISPSLRAEMERRFVHDFAGVRVHTGSVAATVARTLRASAFTVGHDIVLGHHPQAGASGARDVLMHELGHVVEQDRAVSPSGGALVIGRANAPAERAADRLASEARQAPGAVPDRRGAAPLRGRRAGPEPRARNAGVVRRQVAPQGKRTRVPVIPTPPEPAVVHAVTDFLGRGFKIPAARAGVAVISGGTMRLYRNEKRQATIRLAANSYPLSPGYYGPGGRNRDGTSAVTQLYQGDQQDWLQISRGDPDPALSSRIDVPVPEDEAAYATFRDSIDKPLVWAVLRPQPTGTGGDGGEGGDGGGGEPEPLPSWATRINTLVQSRLRGEQLRLAALDRDTIGDTRPETLRRMWAAEGVPKRLALGRSGTSPAVQVTVERTKGAATADASASVRLAKGDDADVVWERILTAGRSLYAGQEGSGAAAAPGPDPIGVLAEGKVDPDAVPPNQKAYPSSIRYYGPATGVTNVALHFTMNLDWNADGEFAVFGPMALRSYAWRFVRIQDTAGSGVDESDRRARRREVASAKFDQGFGDLGEDIESSSTGELLVSHDLVAVDAVVRGAGTLIKSFVALASQPNNEQVIRFDRSGVYLVTCVSSHGPVYATERNPTPFVRAPSVAAYTLRVQSPQELARGMVAPTQLEAARARLVELAAEAEQAPANEQAEAQKEVRDQQAEVDRLVELERSGLPRFLGTQVEATRQQIALVRRLIDLQSKGTTPTTWTDFEARLLLVDLEMKHLRATDELKRLEAAAAQLQVQQRSLGEVGDLKDAGYRPQVAFVPDTDGRALPVVMQLAERADSTDSHQRWVLIDVSVSGHRDRYEGSSSRGGAAGRAAAITNAFEDFAGEVPYGRGEIGIRLPDVLLDQLEGHSVPTRLRAHPDANERFWGRLESLATAAAIAGLVVTGPAAVVLGVVGGVAGGAVAARRMHRRYEGGYLELDLTTAMDVFAVVGAFAGVAGPAARAVPAGSRFVTVAKGIERSAEIYGYVQLGTSVIVIPIDYAKRLGQIPADASPGERAALAAEAFLAVANQSLQLSVGAAQMVRHASTPREGRQPGEPDLPAAREAPALEPPGGQRPPADQRPSAEQRPPAEERRPAEGAKVGEPVKAVDEPAPSSRDSLEQVDIEHGMVLMAPEGRSLSRRYATDLFGNAVESTRFAEVALLRNVESGDFVVVIGDDVTVKLGESNPDWHQILPERAHRGRWVLEEHSHAADRLTGQTPNRGRWPSGPDGDFLIVVAEAQRTGRVARGKIRVHAAGGQQVTEYAYHPGTARPYAVDIALPGGRRYQKRYAMIEDYLADFSARTGEPAPRIPDEFPGARRTRPTPAAERTPATSAEGTGRAEPVIPDHRGPGQDVPPVARVPGGVAGEAPPIRNRRQELTTREHAVREAAESGDPSRIAEANQRLLDLDRELLTGLEGTDLTAQQVAKMADAGLDVTQMRALRAWAGQRADGVVKLNPGQLKKVGEFAARIEPLLGDATTQAALTHLQEAGTVNPGTIAQHLGGVPAEQLPALLRVLADPLLQLGGLQEQHWKLLSNPNVVALIDVYGSAIWRGLYESKSGGRSHTVLKRLAARVAKSPGEGEALVGAVITARTPRAQEVVLDIPAPPRAARTRRGPEVTAAHDDLLWGNFVADAQTFVATHAEWLALATAGKNPPTRAQLIERVATIGQIRSLARRGQYDHLTREQRVTFLDDYIRYTRETGFTGDYVGPGNQASGALSEALFLPPGARRGVRLVHPPKEPSAPGGPAQKVETTLPDYEMPAPDRLVQGVRNFVEQKSNELSADRGSEVNARDVGLAKKHRSDARDDQPGIAAAAAETLPGFEAPAGGAVHLIEYVRVPNEATREAMYDVLLAPESPLTAVKFGDLPWMTRQAWSAQRAANDSGR